MSSLDLTYIEALVNAEPSPLMAIDKDLVVSLIAQARRAQVLPQIAGMLEAEICMIPDCGRGVCIAFQLAGGTYE